jgi:hypothetical protein
LIPHLQSASKSGVQIYFIKLQGIDKLSKELNTETKDPIVATKMNT